MVKMSTDQGSRGYRSGTISEFYINTRKLHAGIVLIIITLV